jgi:hypothetical protein
MWRAARTVVALVAVGLALTACGTAQTHTAGSPGATSGGSAGPTGTTTTGGSAGLAVSPERGGPHTTFTIAFTAPASTEPGGGARIGYTAAVTGGAGGTCVGTRSLAIGAATKGLPVTLALDPARFGGAWCAGVHTVRVIEIEAPVCNPGTMCPQYVRVIGTVGVARFTVGS